MVFLNRSEVLDTAPFYRRGVTKELSGTQWKYSNIHYCTTTSRTLLRFESGCWAEVDTDLNIMQAGKGKLSQPETVTYRGSTSPSPSPLRRNNSGAWWLAVVLGGSHSVWRVSWAQSMKNSISLQVSDDVLRHTLLHVGQFKFVRWHTVPKSF